jgi:hypothetical protein
MTDRPPPEPVPPRALHVPPFRGEEFDALVRQLDVSEAASAVPRPPWLADRPRSPGEPAFPVAGASRTRTLPHG